MKVWKCHLCTRKEYLRHGWLVRHLVSIHRKQRMPRDITLKSAIDLANEGMRETKPEGW